MAEKKVRFGKGVSVEYGVTYLIDPAEIVVAGNPNNPVDGRWKPVTVGEVKSLAFDIAEKGQLQNVIVRKVDGKPTLAFGYTRFRAVKYINENLAEFSDFLSEAIPLECKFVDATDQEAFLMNIAENSDRVKLSDMDRAFLIDKMSTEFNMKNKEIANRLRIRQSACSNLKKLLQLPEFVQNKVHKGSLSAQTAITLVGIDGDELKSAMKEAEREEGGKINGEELKRVIRRRVAETETGEGENNDSDPPAKKYTPISMKDIKSFWSQFADDPEEDPAIAEFAKKHLLFIAGKRQPKTMAGYVRELRNALPATEPTALPSPASTTEVAESEEVENAAA